jgi:AcrR family transcriptional regulator
MTVRERRERERADRRQVIVTAARQVAEAEGWDAVTTRRLADRIEYSQPVLYSHFENKDAIVAAVAVEGFGELALSLHNAREAASSPKAAFREVARTYVEFAIANPALYDAMFSLATDLPFSRPEAPEELHAGFEELRESVTPLAGDRDPDTLTEVVWSALHGLATLTRAGRLRPDYHEARVAVMIDHLGAAPACPG